MDVKLSIDDQDKWEQRRQRLEALNRAFPSQQQRDPAQHKIVDPVLHSAAKKGDVDEFIRALEDYCPKERVSLPVLLRLRSPSKNTLLHAAAESSDDIVRTVIDFVPKDLISCQNSRGETPLHIAARAGKAGAVKLLLPRGIPTCTDHNGNSALHEAVRRCRPEVRSRCLEERSHRYEVIRRLVSEYPNMLYHQNKESKSPWCLAVETGDLEVLDLLLRMPNDGEDQSRSESQRDCGMSPVHVAILHKKMDMLKKMWEKKPGLFQWKDAGDGTPLHLAVYTNYLDGVKFLIEKFPPSALEQDSMGYLPIHVACMMDHVRIVEELFEQWPDPAEFLTRLGQNILHVSARYKSTATVKYILKSPKSDHLINARDFDGNTPLHLAALHCQPSVVLLSRDSRVDLKLVNNNNMTALDVVEHDIKVIEPSLGKRITHATIKSAGTPRSGELTIRKPTGRSPWKRLGPPDWERNRDQVNTYAVVAALVASVTFTSGFIIPGGYNGSEGNASSRKLHETARIYVFFVTCNSIAMYSSIMALVILLGSSINDPYVGKVAILLSNIPMLVALGTMALAFSAGVFLTVAKHAGLSFLIYFFGNIAAYIIMLIFAFPYLPFGSGRSIFRGFDDKVRLCGLKISGGDPAGSEAESSVRGTRDDNQPPPT